MKKDPVFVIPSYLNNKLAAVVARIQAATFKLMKIERKTNCSEISTVIKELDIAVKKIIKTSQKTTAFLYHLKSKRKRSLNP